MRRAVADPPAGRVARPRAYGYFRVSDPRQATDDRWSLPKQRADFARRCTEKGYEPAGEFQDVMSGGRADRPGYQRMIAAAKAGEIDVVVVADTSRFGRDREEAVYRFLWLKIECGVDVDFIHEDHRDLVDFVEDADYAHKERGKISKRVKRTMGEAAEAGHWQGRAPFGYRVEHGNLVVHEAEAAVVRRVFALYADEVMGCSVIARALNDEGVRTRHGKPIQTSTIIAMLRRPAYRGIMDRLGVTITDHHEAIISEELWGRAQRLRERKNELRSPRSHRSTYLLSGLIYCGHCQGRMQGHNDRYRCMNRYVGLCRSLGEKNAVSRARLEAEVLEALTERLGSLTAAERDTVEEMERARAEVKLTSAEVESISARFERNLSLLYDDRFSADEFDRANEIVRRQQEAAEARRDAALERYQAAIAASEVAAVTSQQMGTLLDFARSGEAVKAKAILQAIVGRIVVTGDEVYIERRL